MCLETGVRRKSIQAIEYEEEYEHRPPRAYWIHEIPGTSPVFLAGSKETNAKTQRRKENPISRHWHSPEIRLSRMVRLWRAPQLTIYCCHSRRLIEFEGFQT